MLMCKDKLHPITQAPRHPVFQTPVLVTVTFQLVVLISVLGSPSHVMQTSSIMQFVSIIPLGQQSNSFTAL